MVSCWARAGLASFLLIAGVEAVSARDLADYHLGDRLEEDVVTPVPLKVVDMDASTALKEKEAMRVLVILRHDPSVLNDVEADFREAFSNTRSNFLRSVERYFNKRKLAPTTVASPEFELVRVEFELLRSKKAFPLSSNLAAIWALGDSGRAQQAVIIDRLRESMRQPIRDPNAPASIKVTTRARLVSVTDRDEELTLASLGNRGKTIPRTNAVSLDRARRDFIARFPPEELAAAKFAASLIQPNCRLEEKLTEQLRAQRIETLWSLTEYAANDIIGRKGEVVDARILAALQAILEKRAEAGLKQAAQIAAQRAQQTEKRFLWLGIVSSGVTLALVLVTWQWWRRRREVSLLPMRSGGTEITGWQQRALTAERHAEQAQEALRAGVLNEVSSVLKEELVQGLVAQRKELIEAQQAAATEMAALEQRLNALQLPLQERLLAYAARIGELETALLAKDEQNRELIKAKIELVRQQLEAERAKGQVVMN